MGSRCVNNNNLIRQRLTASQYGFGVIYTELGGSPVYLVQAGQRQMLRLFFLIYFKTSEENREAEKKGLTHTLLLCTRIIPKSAKHFSVSTPPIK